MPKSTYGPIFCSSVLVAISTFAAPQIQAPLLPYDPSAYELAADFTGPQRPQEVADAQREFKRRLALEADRKEMPVYYYRIGHTLSYPLMLEKRPTLSGLPSGIPAFKYPYLIWLAWNMEERWVLLHHAWRKQGDTEAAAVLQRELAALEGWDRFVELNESVGLVTGHFAGVLATALSDPSGWDPKLLERTRKAASALIERDVWPWFEAKWKQKELSERDIVNIPVIALVRAAQLARVLGSPRTQALDERSKEVFQTWCTLRTSANHTEGTAYDGFLMDSVTAWLEALPDREPIRQCCAEALRDLQLAWVHLTLPGRVDLHAPFGDVEPEMTFWVTALQRINVWQPSAEATWLLQRFPLNRMRAPAVIQAMNALASKTELSPPAQRSILLPNAAVFRTGWADQDLMLAASVSRGKMGHLQADSGSIVFGHAGRFWITDPGYQQYRPGQEKEFTLDAGAHNAPVINGVAQSFREPSVLKFDEQAGYVVLDLTRCYRGLPKEASIRRTVRLGKGSPGSAKVEDVFEGLAPESEIRTSWQGGHHFGWAFPDGQARLSDERKALWIGTSAGDIRASELLRHPGSRGPLTLSHTNSLASGRGTNVWTFRFASDLSFNPPTPGVED